MSLRTTASAGVASITAGIGSCQAPKSARRRAGVSPLPPAPAGAFHDAYQMIRSPVAGARPKRAPRPHVSIPSLGTGSAPFGVRARTAV